VKPSVRSTREDFPTRAAKFKVITGIFSSKLRCRGKKKEEKTKIESDGPSVNKAERA
jgi:hypothetical protein